MRLKDSGEKPQDLRQISADFGQKHQDLMQIFAISKSSHKIIALGSFMHMNLDLLSLLALLSSKYWYLQYWNITVHFFQFFFLDHHGLVFMFDTTSDACLSLRSLS